MALGRRFDDAGGPDGWRDEYAEVRSGKGITCTLTLHIPDPHRPDHEVVRQAVAGYADGPPGVVVEEAYDTALCRAAAKLGMYPQSYKEAAERKRVGNPREDHDPP